jgi:hypothetical protein
MQPVKQNHAVQLLRHARLYYLNSRGKDSGASSRTPFSAVAKEKSVSRHLKGLIQGALWTFAMKSIQTT